MSTSATPQHPSSTPGGTPELPPEQRSFVFEREPQPQRRRLLRPAPVQEPRPPARLITLPAGSTRPRAIYLSASDVRELVCHTCHLIPLNRGYLRSHVESHYSGWDPHNLATVVKRATGFTCSSLFAGRETNLKGGALGVLLLPDGRVLLDDGSIEHPAKALSWSRVGPVRVSEHCRFEGYRFGNPGVLVHAPHTSKHIPSAVKADFCISEDELRAEIETMTDSGVSDMIAALDRSQISTVTATMSRLVFDPERFPESDPMEDVGMGLVYTRRADGFKLRHDLSPDRLRWYREQHAAYTVSLENLVRGYSRSSGVVIVDLHSYPERPLPHEDAALERPQVCIGTDPFHTPFWLADLLREELGAAYSVASNTPFSGAYVPGRLYGTAPNVLSVMVEVRRDVIASAEAAATFAQHLNSAISKIREIREETRDQL